MILPRAPLAHDAWQNVARPFRPFALSETHQLAATNQPALARVQTREPREFCIPGNEDFDLAGSPSSDLLADEAEQLAQPIWSVSGTMAEVSDALTRAF